MTDTMAKKRPKASGGSANDPHRGLQTNLRFVDPRLLEILDGWAESQRRSRNLAINLLLEEALAAKGLWPPSESPAKGTGS